MSTADAYCALHKAVAAALESVVDSRKTFSRLAPAESQESFAASTAVTSRAYECFQNPVAGDVVADGRKLAGGAQRRTKWGMLHQGSIAEQISAAELQAGCCRTLGVEFLLYELSESAHALAETLVREKYAADQWNRRVT